jgi:hypothetical protein
MKKIKSVTSILLFLTLAVLPVKETLSFKITATNDRISITRWDILVEAIATVESDKMEYAVGDSMNWGYLQIMPIYVRECNRLLGQEKYTILDAFDKYKSIEMFNLYQTFKNPARDPWKAARLHNPTAGTWYASRVMKVYNMLLVKYAGDDIYRIVG